MVKLAKLDPVINLLVNFLCRVRLIVLDFHIRNCDMAAPHYGAMLRKRNRIAQGRLFP